MKLLGYIFRNVTRNPLRVVLTIGALTICGFLAMFLFTFIDINKQAANASRAYNRLVSMSSQGFSGRMPYAQVREIERIDRESKVNGILRFEMDFATGRPVFKDQGRAAITPMAWVGNKYKDDPIPFTQFAVDPETFFAVYEELRVPGDQIQAFMKQRTAAIIGRKLARDKKLKIGDTMPMKQNFYPVDLDLTVVGIYDAPPNKDERWCILHWDYLNETLKTKAEGRNVDNAGTVFAKCKSAAVIPRLAKAIDDTNRSSDNPTRSQTEEAFIAMFAEMLGGLQDYINGVGLAVLGALMLICFVSLSMSVRERTNEVAVLRAIGFRKGHVLFMVLVESLVVAAIGGLIGTIGVKLLFDVFDVAPLLGGNAAYFVVPWFTATGGFVGAMIVGLISGLVPAISAARLPVIDGLRKVV